MTPRYTRVPLAVASPARGKDRKTDIINGHVGQQDNRVPDIWHVWVADAQSDGLNMLGTGVIDGDGRKIVWLVTVQVEHKVGGRHGDRDFADGVSVLEDAGFNEAVSREIVDHRDIEALSRGGSSGLQGGKSHGELHLKYLMKRLAGEAGWFGMLLVGFVMSDNG